MSENVPVLIEAKRGTEVIWSCLMSGEYDVLSWPSESVEQYVRAALGRMGWYRWGQREDDISGWSIPYEGSLEIRRLRLPFVQEGAS